MRPLPKRDARDHDRTLGDPRRLRSPTCASTPTTTRWTPASPGRRVEVRVGQREIAAIALDSGRGRRPPPAQPSPST